MEQLTITGVSEHRCLRCGHLLTDPLSIDRGYGPGCWNIVGKPRTPTMIRRDLSLAIMRWTGTHAPETEIAIRDLLLELHPITVRVRHRP